MPAAGLERRDRADDRRPGQPSAEDLGRRAEGDLGGAVTGRVGRVSRVGRLRRSPFGEGVGQGDDGLCEAARGHRRAAVRAVRDRPGGLAEQAGQPAGVPPGGLVLSPDHGAQRQPGLETLRGRQAEAGQGLREVGDVGQGQFGVEQTSVEQPGRRAVGHRARIPDLGVDHQGGLVQPDEVPVQPAGVPRALLRFVEQIEREGGHLAGPRRERAVGARERLGPVRPEEGDPGEDVDREAHADLGGDPARLARRDAAVQVEADEVADEQHHPGEGSARPETPEVDAHGHEDRHGGQAQGPVAAERGAQEQRRDHRDGRVEHGDQLAAGGLVDDRDGREQSDESADHHGDQQVRVVRRGRPGGRQAGTVGLDLQGVGEMHEEPLGHEDERDGQHALQGHAEPVLPGVGTGEAVDPPVPGPHRAQRDGRHGVPGFVPSRYAARCQVIHGVLLLEVAQCCCRSP